MKEINKLEFVVLEVYPVDMGAAKCQIKGTNIKPTVMRAPKGVEAGDIISAHVFGSSTAIVPMYEFDAVIEKYND